MITVRELMTPVGTRVGPEQPLTDVLALMQRNRHSCAVVVEAGRLLGLVRERDLMDILAGLLAGGETPAHKAADIMMTRPVCVPAEASLLEALRLVHAHQQRQIPVLDEQSRLAGMITQTDMAQAYIGILERQSELASANRVLQAESLQDSLLGIGNRRAMERDLDRFRGCGEPLFALALLDLDWFKKYNDYYGHQAGDRALRQVSDTIQKHLREGDSLYRYGGEELLLLMNRTGPDGAWRGANRVREAVQALAIEHAPSPKGVLTLSAGVASEPGVDIEPLIAAADRALYDAKTHGHNRVVSARVTRSAPEMS